MESTMETVLASLAQEIAALDVRLSGLGPDDWGRASWCDGWSVADVVLHLAQTNEMAVASAEDRFHTHLASLSFGGPADRPLAPAPADDRAPDGEADARSPASAGTGDVAWVEDGAGALVIAERGAPAGDVFERWRRSAQAMCGALAAREGSDRVQWVAGDLAARTLATTRLSETWIHAGDIAWAFGEDPTATDRLWHVARLAWRTLPYAFAGVGRSLTGPVAFELSSPAGDVWSFRPDSGVAATVVSGPAVDLCLVAGRRRAAGDTQLMAEGPDAADVLELVRTFA
ncbi:MAG: maleylpyruvate isomerase family mycothiol-dependent enzyme [Acidimicrobiia bacterium]|nr:maleylpyruvate isomerase family mycothiol-dependent enzyme [Acidimicrobiia bacterium]